MPSADGGLEIVEQSLAFGRSDVFNQGVTVADQLDVRTRGRSIARTHRRELLHKQPDCHSNVQSLRTVNRTAALPETRT